MYLADYHTHTRFSPDGRASMTQMAQAAVQAGMQEICFTDHVEPLVWGQTALRPPYDWEPLLADFAQAKADMGDQITLRLGIELGDAVWSIPHTQRLLTGAPEWDFIIGSIHMLSAQAGGQDLYFFDPKTEEEARAGIRDYLGQVLKLAQWGKFSVLGHLTLPLRYLNENRGFSLTFDGFEKEMEEIFRTLIDAGCGIELNTNRGNAPLPGEKWLRMYRQLGGEIITLGTDAHRPDAVGCAVEEGQKLLRRCGFAGFYTFKGQKPVFHPW